MDNRSHSKKNSINIPFNLTTTNQIYSNTNSDSMTLKTMKISDLYKNMYTKDAGRAINSLKENYLYNNLTKSILKMRNELNNDIIKGSGLKYKSVKAKTNTILSLPNCNLTTEINNEQKYESISQMKNSIIHEKYYNLK